MPAKIKAKSVKKISDTPEVQCSSARSLDEAIRECKVDLETWDIDHYTIEENSKGFNYKIYLKKKSITRPDIEELKRELRNEVAPAKEIKYKRKDSGLLLEFAPFDLHWGKLSWGEESGEDYDMKEAAIALNKSIDYTLEVASKFNIGRIVFPFGNDFFQIDNEQGTTTAGTPQDTDSRFKKILREGRKIIITTIEKLKKVAPVDVVVVAGNHDTLSSFTLGELLAVRYDSDRNVRINNSPTYRKYYNYGKNLILYTHGNEEKIESLPLIMATERPEDWGKSKYRYVKLGHLHQERVREISGTTIEHLPALSGSDAWHAKKGYVGNKRGVCSAIYDKDMGLINKIYFNL